MTLTDKIDAHKEGFVAGLPKEMREILLMSPDFPSTTEQSPMKRTSQWILLGDPGMMLRRLFMRLSVLSDDNPH